MHEGIPILNFHVPKAFVHEGRQAHRHDASRRSRPSTTTQGRRTLVPTGEPDVLFECDDVLVAVGQENAFPWIERDMRHRVRRVGHAGARRGDACSRRVPQRLLRRRCGVRAEEHHLGGGARPRGGDLDRPASCTARTSHERPPPHGQPGRRRRWASTSGATTTTSSIDTRYKVPLGRGREGAGEHQESRSSSASTPRPPARRRSAA